MHGAGNDFVVLDGVRQHVELDAGAVAPLADRHFGVGADQILLVERPRSPDVDFRYRIFNADGGEVEQCGNGARCFVRFVRDQGLTDKRAIRVETLVRRDRAAPRGRRPRDRRHGPAGLRARAHPVRRPPTKPSRVGDDVALAAAGARPRVLGRRAVDGQPARGAAGARTSTRRRWPTKGPLIENHPAFPNRVNAGFMQVLSRTASDCACTSAARARRWPAAPVPAPRWCRASGAGCCARRSTSRRAAAC